MAVPLLKHGPVLIASVQDALSDGDWIGLRDELASRAGRDGITGVIIDITALDVLDSYATRTLKAIAEITRLRGARTVLCGVQPEVAYAMVQLGLTLRLRHVETALDLEAALIFFEQQSRHDGHAH